MNKSAAVIAALLLSAAACFAVPSDVVYSDGEASVRYKSGSSAEVAIGDLLDTGDTVTTGFDGFVDLDQDGLTVKINPDTIFTLQEKEQGGERAGVLALVLGSIKFRFDRLTGREPLVQTGACNAGVRGTEFTVFAGADGSSLILVDSGLVEVEAAGGAVSLGAAEGVEVRPGEPPGEKFDIKSRQVDYKAWNDERVQTMLADPEAAMSRLADRLAYYVESISSYDALYRGHSARLAEERAKAGDINAREGAEAAARYQREMVFPLTVQTANLHLNVRFFSLAALSLRRYVSGRLYVMLKATHMGDAAGGSYGAFLRAYGAFLDEFENAVAPHLVERDL